MPTYLTSSFRLIVVVVFGCLSGSFLIAQPGPVTGIELTAYDHHVELNWDQHPNPTVQGYRIYGSTAAAGFNYLGFVNNVTTDYIHFLGDWDVEGRYYLEAVGSGGQLSAPSDTLTATTFQMTDEELLDMVQAYTLRYFYDFGHPVSGLARERNSTNTVTSGGSGFGVMALIVGAERGFITYDQALIRTEKIVDFLLTVPRFKGAFSHWLNGATGQVIPFSQLDNGGDLVETAFLIQGLLTARQYYSGDSETEVDLRDKITQIWEEVNWNWYRKIVDDVLYWHWSPDNEFAINLPIRGFNESHIVYILGIAAPLPANDIPVSLYHSGWAAGDYENNLTHYGYPLEVGRNKGGPLFFSHYSYLGFDPRGIADQYTNYFARNSYHSLINYSHCVDNPYNRTGYGPDNWGLTASDDPNGYLAHAPRNATSDNGTISPTAALSSFPYTPNESMRALKYFYRELGAQLWGKYGFKDAFNQTTNWFANSYLAIDQGPIICMIENHRSGLLWDLFMQNPEIQPALDAIGFIADDTEVINPIQELPGFLSESPRLFPNPAAESVRMTMHLKENQNISVTIHDQYGRMLEQLHPPAPLPAGEQLLHLVLPETLPPAYYFIKIKSSAGQYSLPLLIQH